MCFSWQAVGLLGLVSSCGAYIYFITHSPQLSQVAIRCTGRRSTCTEHIDACSLHRCA
jgi:hypothetical protein